MNHAEELNGDLPLARSQRRHYLADAIRELRGQRGIARLWKADIELGIRLAGLGASPLRVYASGALAQFAQAQVKGRDLVCDVGAGHGGNARAFAGTRNVRYLAVDIAATEKWAEPRDRWFVVGSALQLPVRTASMDVVMTASSLEHMPHIEQVGSELARVMRQGAVGWHLVPSPASLLLYGYHGYRRFSPDRLREVLTRDGVEVIEVFSLGGLATFLLHLVWITWLETGAIYGVLTLGAIGRSRGLGPRLRQGPALRLYAPLLRWAMRLDRRLRFVPAAYVAIVRKSA